MGVTLCLTTDLNLDSPNVAWLDKGITRALMLDSGWLRAWLTAEQAALLDHSGGGETSDPASGKPVDPVAFGAVFRHLLDRLAAENETLPVLHMLWRLDDAGERRSGCSSLNLPDDPEMVHPHPPMARLDGGHGDPAHRNELQRFAVRIDPDRLARWTAFMQEQRARAGIKEGEPFYFLMPYANSGAPANPMVEEPDGWVPVAPVVEVLGCRIAVDSLDALAQFGPELDGAIAACDRAAQEHLPLYWVVA